MSGESAVPAPVTQKPVIVPPVPGSEGSGALAKGPAVGGEAPKDVKTVEDMLEFELDVKGQKQKLSGTKEQVRAMLQKALYADQMIKDAAQAKKGSESLMAKLKTPQGIREVLSDPEIGVDIKSLALTWVREMMDEEKLTPEQRRLRDLENENKTIKERIESEERMKKEQAELEKTQKMAAGFREQIITAMQKFSDLPQDQATMDRCIQYMRSGYKRFGKVMSPEQAMTLVQKDFWGGISNVLKNMPAEQILERFGKETLDKLQALRLKELKGDLDPNKGQTATSGATGKKRAKLTEKEFDRNFSQRLAGLG